MKKNDTLITYGAIIARIKCLEETFPRMSFGTTSFSKEYLNTWFETVKGIRAELNSLYDKKTKLEKTLKENKSVKMTIRIDPSVDIDGKPVRAKLPRNQLLSFNKRHKIKILA